MRASSRSERVYETTDASFGSISAKPPSEHKESAIHPKLTVRTDVANRQGWATSRLTAIGSSWRKAAALDGVCICSHASVAGEIG